MVAQPDWLTYGVPTLDRPFGVALWPIFSKAFEAVKGYPAEDFRFVDGQTPMSTLSETAIGLVSYYLIIFGGREMMRDRQPMQLNGLFKIHNFYLTAISGVLLVLFLEQLIPTVVRNGVFFGICSYEGGWTDQLVVLYYVSPPSPETPIPNSTTNTSTTS
jgi:fatty acid elongase 3